MPGLDSFGMDIDLKHRTFDPQRITEMLATNGLSLFSRRRRRKGII
jgi:hypothetical protein